MRLHGFFNFSIVVGVAISDMSFAVSTDWVWEEELAQSYSKGEYHEVFTAIAPQLTEGKRLSPHSEEILLLSLFRTGNLSRILVYEEKFGLKEESSVSSRVLIGWAAHFFKKNNLGNTYLNGIDISQVTDKKVKKLYYFARSFEFREKENYPKAIEYLLASGEDEELTGIEYFLLARYYREIEENEHSLSSMQIAVLKYKAPALYEFTQELANVVYIPLYTRSEFVEAYVFITKQVFGVTTRYLEVNRTLGSDEISLLLTIIEIGGFIFDANQEAGNTELTQQVLDAVVPLKVNISAFYLAVMGAQIQNERSYSKITNTFKKVMCTYPAVEDQNFLSGLARQHLELHAIGHPEIVDVLNDAWFEETGTWLINKDRGRGQSRNIVINHK